MRFVAGRDLNLLERARVVTPSPAANADFGIARLYDGYADGIFRFGSNAVNPSLTVDLAMLDSTGGDNGSFDSWAGGVPPAWAVTQTGGGAVTRESPGRGGSGSAAKLQKNGGVARVLKTYRVRSGERLTVEHYLARNAAGSAAAQIYNPVTKKYLTSGGAWQSAQAYWATEAASAAYVQKTLAFQVEDFQAHQAGTGYLEVSAEDNGAGGASDYALVDDVALWPTWNAAVIVGHNIDPGMVVDLLSDTAGFAGAGTLEATLTPRRPSFFGYLAAAAAKRYARLAFTGTQASQSGAVFMGELVLCYLETALVPLKWDWELQFMFDQVRNTMDSGHVAVAEKTIDPRRVLRMSFRRSADPKYREGRDEIVRRSAGGAWPFLVVPMDAEDIVVHARLDSSWNVLRHFVSYWQDDLTAAETPMPEVTS